MVKHILLVWLFAGLAWCPAIAQQLEYQFSGSANSDYGDRVSGVGDVDADGSDDFIIGAFRDSTAGASAGRAEVLSGANGNLLWEYFGSAANAYFGRSVAGAGDLNQDGHADFLIGASGESNRRGAVRAYSGLDGSLLYEWFGQGTFEDFGFAVDTAGDLNGDNVPDVIAGGPGAGYGGTKAGIVRVFSGQDGSLLYSYLGTTEDQLGYAVSGAGDVNDDGFHDFLIGSPFSGKNIIGSRGSFALYSGVDGSQMIWVNGTWFTGETGAGLSELGDIDLDGYDDFIVGTPREPVGDDDRGVARVYSGQTLQVLYHLKARTSGDDFGRAVAAAGDVDADGYPDIVVGSRGHQFQGATPGAARVFSGEDGKPMFTLRSDFEFSGYSDAVAAVGDLNADGFSDLIVGEPEFDSVWVYSGGPQMHLGDPQPGLAGMTNTVTVSGAEPFEEVWMFTGNSPGQFASVAGCTHLSFDFGGLTGLAMVVADASGQATMSGFAPPAVSGKTIPLQASQATACRVSQPVYYTFP